MVSDKSAFDLRRQIGDRFRTERERLGLSRIQIAELLDVNRTTISNYEAGTHMPAADQLNFLGSIGMDAAYVVTGAPSLALASNQERFVKSLCDMQAYCRLSKMNVSEVQIILSALVFVHGFQSSDLERYNELVKAVGAGLRETTPV